jgi:hypothetical protein
MTTKTTTGFTQSRKDAKNGNVVTLKTGRRPFLATLRLCVSPVVVVLS